MSALNPSDTALLCAIVLERVAPVKSVYRAVRSVHNATRDLLDAFDLCAQDARKASPTPKQR